MQLESLYKPRARKIVSTSVICRYTSITYQHGGYKSYCQMHHQHYPYNYLYINMTITITLTMTMTMVMTMTMTITMNLFC